METKRMANNMFAATPGMFSPTPGVWGSMFYDDEQDKAKESTQDNS